MKYSFKDVYFLCGLMEVVNEQMDFSVATIVFYSSNILKREVK
jgi:hypothetical protein